MRAPLREVDLVPAVLPEDSQLAGLRRVLEAEFPGERLLSVERLNGYCEYPLDGVAVRGLRRLLRLPPRVCRAGHPLARPEMPVYRYHFDSGRVVERVPLTKFLEARA